MTRQTTFAIRKHTLQQNNTIPVLQRYEIIDLIKQMNTSNPLRDKALVAFLFLTACRISEVVKYHNQKEKKLVANSIQKKQISIDFEHDLMMVYNARTLKRKDTSATKNIPIIISKEKDLFDLFYAYYQSLADSESFLFNITRQRAFQILSMNKLWNHYLRHLRLTNLSIEYNFSSQELKHFVNWANSNMADKYVHLNVQNLIDKMKR